MDNNAKRNWNPKTNSQGNQNGSFRNNILKHVQRIEGETTTVEYNLSKSSRSSMRMKRYAELMRNHKKQGIKSLCDNNLNQYR